MCKKSKETDNNHIYTLSTIIYYVYLIIKHDLIILLITKHSINFKNQEKMEHWVSNKKFLHGKLAHINLKLIFHCFKCKETKDFIINIRFLDSFKRNLCWLQNAYLKNKQWFKIKKQRNIFHKITICRNVDKV